MAREMVICRKCSYLGSIEKGDRIPKCPSCSGERLFMTGVSKDEWASMDNSAQIASKSHWLEGKTGKYSDISINYENSMESVREYNQTHGIIDQKASVSAESVRGLKNLYTSLFEESKEKIKKEPVLMHIDGIRGRRITIYPSRCEICTDVTLGSLVTGNATDGRKTIYYKDVIGLQFKPSGMTIGYLQFETATSTQNNGNSNFFNENTFTFGEELNEFMEDVYQYIITLLDDVKIEK